MMPSIDKYFNTSWVRMRAKPPDIVEKVKAYLHNSPTKPVTDRYREACSRVRDAFRLYGKVKPYHIHDSIRFYQHPERSPGLPHTRLGYHRKDEVPAVKYKQFVHDLKYRVITHCAIPCTAAAKSMVAPEPKFRLIWVYPAYMTLAEGMFAQPLINAYKGHRGQYGIWIQYANRHIGIPYLMTRKLINYQWLGLDWSSFDVNVPPWLIKEAFSILRDQMDFSNYEFYGAPTDKESLPNLWKAIVKYFIDTPIRLPSGRVIVKHQGVPSGSFFTSMIDSICNAIMVNFLLGDKYQRSACWYLGDDCLVAIPKTIDVSKLSQEALVTFGAVLNPDKSEQGPLVSFLGYRMTSDMYPGSNFEKLSAQTLLPDRPDRCIDDTAARVLALQLSCFGKNSEYIARSQQFLMDNNLSGTYRLRKRDDILRWHSMVGIEWMPLKDMQMRI